MEKARRALVVAALTLASCSGQMLPASTPTTEVTALRIYVTTPLIPLINTLTAAYSRVNSAVVFEVNTGNYEAMVDQVLLHDDAYLLTNYLPPEELGPLIALPIAQDGIAVIVHPANVVGNLTVARLRSIYQGWINNWAELGGADLPITVISREDGSGTRLVFENLVMGDRRTTTTAQIAPSSAAVVTSVARTPGAIGYVSMSYLNSSVYPLRIENVAPTLENVANNAYPLRALVYFAGLQEPETHFRNFIGWAQSPDGQAVIAQNYAPLLNEDVR
ncbi:MAG: phosphate ABC transporter substrate-binding protein [Chloroflexi bacterium]|nr:phosphate ABC transporter substrate-binding protein [Chloroflexota bacterium]